VLGRLSTHGIVCTSRCRISMAYRIFLQTLCCGKVDILAIGKGDSQARALRYRGAVEPVTP
jgi:hypothetical protein